MELGGIHSGLDPLALVITAEDASKEYPSNTIGTMAGLYVPVIANNNSLLNRKSINRDEIFINIHWMRVDSCFKYAKNNPIWVRPMDVIVPVFISPGILRLDFNRYEDAQFTASPTIGGHLLHLNPAHTIMIHTKKEESLQEGQEGGASTPHGHQESERARSWIP